MNQSYVQNPPLNKKRKKPTTHDDLTTIAPFLIQIANPIEYFHTQLYNFIQSVQIEMVTRGGPID